MEKKNRGVGICLNALMQKNIGIISESNYESTHNVFADTNIKNDTHQGIN